MASTKELIVKNTIILYIRTAFILVVSLFSSRVLLQELGIEDFGIYSVIGGVTTVFAFVNNAITSAIQRFFTYDLGKNNKEHYRAIFSCSLEVLIFVSAIVLILCETVGLWFVENKLNIPLAKQDSAFWVYQFSIFTFIILMLRSPCMASIIAHEKMDIYAYLSIGEYTLKLIIIYALMLSDTSKLVLYSAYYFSVTLIFVIIGWWYCTIKFEVCKYVRKIGKPYFIEILSFSSWTIIGQIAVIVFNHGRVFLVNIFKGVALNATLGIVSQLSSAINVFVTNFQTAFNPQITKTYAAREIEAHNKLLFGSSKVSFLLILFIATPAIINMDFVLNLWLDIVPKYTKEFTILTIASYCVASLSAPFSTSVFADGRIRKYQIILSSLFLLGLLLTYVTIKIAPIVYIIMLVDIGVQVALLILRIYIVKRNIGISIKSYFNTVIKPIIIVTAMSLPFTYCITKLPIISPWLYFLMTSLLVCIVNILAIFFVGLTKDERKYISELVSNKILNKK